MGPIMIELEYLKSQRGKRILVYLSHLYTCDKSRNDMIRWRCLNRECRGSVFFDNENKLLKSVEHNHDVVREKIEKLKTIQSIRNRAITTTERANDIIISHLSKIQNEDTVVIMPHITTLRDCIRRIRNNLLEYIPSSHQDIPESLKRDLRGDLFLRFDSGSNDPNRIVIFCSEYKIKHFKKTTLFVIDGTFKSSPQGFYQMLVLHGYLFGKTYPFVYIIMSNKLEASYYNALMKCRELFNIKPDFIITDFEKAIINASKNVFPAISSFGCLFHLGQSIWVRIGNLGLINRYRNDLEFKKIIKMLLCLSFVPADDVLYAYQVIKQLISDSNITGLDRFIAYFEKNYIGIFGNSFDDFTKPIFEVKFWNVYYRVMNNLPRTTNNAESWNRTFNMRTAVANPNIAQFINDLLREEESIIFNIKRATIGKFTLKKYCVNEAKIKICVENYPRFDILTYLNVIMNLYNFKFDEYKNEKDK